MICLSFFISPCQPLAENYGAFRSLIWLRSIPLYPLIQTNVSCFLPKHTALRFQTALHAVTNAPYIQSVLWSGTLDHKILHIWAGQRTLDLGFWIPASSGSSSLYDLKEVTSYGAIRVWAWALDGDMALKWKIAIKIMESHTQGTALLRAAYPSLEMESRAIAFWTFPSYSSCNHHFSSALQHWV